MTLLELYNILLEAGIPVWHNEAKQEETPYVIYQETATSYKWASGATLEEHIKVDVVHFTKEEFDPSLERLKEVLHRAKISFTIAHGFDPEAKITISQFGLTVTRCFQIRYPQIRYPQIDRM